MPTTRRRRLTRQTTRRPAGDVKKPSKAVEFLQIATCTTCRKARSFLKKRGFTLNIRDLRKNRLSASELEKLIGPSEHEDFLNPGSKIFRKLGMDEKPPSRREAINFMVKDPNLIRRPIVVAGGRIVVGFDQNGMARL